MPTVVLGSGESNAFISHGQSVYVVPRLAVDWMLGSRVYMAVNGAARLRERRELSNTTAPVTVTDAMGVATAASREDPIIVGKDIQYGAGVGFILNPRAPQA